MNQQKSAFLKKLLVNLKLAKKIYVVDSQGFSSFYTFVAL